ncbi:MAG: type IX secretion system protein PorQ [Prevotella sp.]|jgi:hypothetical protein
MKKVLAAFLFSTIALTLGAQESQTQYNFLRLPVSTRAAALGGDNISVVEDDGNLIFNNPALLSSVSDKTLTLGYMNYMSGVNAGSASFCKTVKERATWAVSCQYIDYGDMKETDENNTDLGSFSAHDISLAGYFSYLLTDRLSGGIAGKMIFSYLGDYNSIGCAVDLGLNYYDADRDWSISLVARNLGGELKAYNEDYGKLPIDLQVGVTKGFANFPFRLSVSLVDLNHWGYSFFDHAVVGAELLLGETLWIGGGYNCRRAHEMKIESSDGESSHGAGITLGGGLTLERFKIGVSWGKYHVSSSSLMVNLGYQF